MANRFTEQASQELNPYFQQQESAVKQQLPAIQQLYDTLLQGLEGQRQTETQNILESASQRGVLRSTLPVDLQTQLGAVLLGERGKLESQRAGDVAGVNKSLADIGLTRAQSISSLADALQSRDLQERDFTLKQQQAERDFQLSQQRLQAETAASRASSGQRDVSGIVNNIGSFLAGKVGKDGKVHPSTFQQGRQQWIAAGGDPDSYNQAFAGYINQSHYWDYLGKK
jgi:hypothetical protein